MKKAIIIGAGISGVYLSILLKQKLNIDVIVLEQNAQPLKKLLATGNGRCNLSNKDMNISYYQSDDLTNINDIISSFDIVHSLNELGLLCTYQGDLLYPKSEQAISVKNILMQRAEELGVLFIYNCEALKIIYNKDYIVKTNIQDFHSDYVIFAMGSEAGKLSGCNKSRYDLLKQLNLSVIDSYPSLVQMKTKKVDKSLKGVRVKGTFKLLENNNEVSKQKGELLFTDYGVSGIAVMQLSAYVELNKKYQISIDFFDDYSYEELYSLVIKRLQKNYEHFYDGLLNNKLSHHFEKMNLKNVKEIVNKLKDYRLDIEGLQSYETAQVMKGGLSMKEVNASLQINKYPNMYAVGEILNVTGLCGGYNIHFALSCANTVANDIERNFYD